MSEPARRPSHAADRNLLFGVLCLQADLINAAQFAEICTAWTARKDLPLADLLRERGWITAADQADIDRLLERKLKKHGDDAHASLAAVADAGVRYLLTAVADPDVQQTLSALPAPDDRRLVATIPYEHDTRDRYLLTRLHARGGIGQIWLAHDSDLGREVALKELKPERASHPEAAARFVEEAKITGQLQHPGIVPVYELGKRSDTQQPFYTMRFVQGRTLARAIKDYHTKRTERSVGALDLQALLAAFVGVCNTVAYAHSRGVLHRDLKPQNVVLGDYGEVMVLDWGLGKVIGRAEQETGTPPVLLEPNGLRTDTVQGQVLGTPAYMAPEQASGRLDLIDRRSDLYSLGAVLYEILTGHPPFDGGDTLEVLRKVRESEPIPPRQLVPEAPAALEAVCLRALAKKREQRYGSAGELAEDVRRFLADEPVTAYVEPVSQRLGRWGRKHRPLVVGAAALLVALVVGLAVSTWLVSREQARTAAALTDKQRAETERSRALVEALRTAEPAALPGVLESLQPLHAEVLPWLQAEAARPDLTENERVRLALALLPSDPQQADLLEKYLLRARSPEFLVIRDALRSQAENLRRRLWPIVEDPARTPEERFRGACALAAFDPGSPRWTAIAPMVVSNLAVQNPVSLADWLTALRPVRDVLRGPLQKAYSHSDQADHRYVLVSALTEFFQDRVDVLTDLVEAADERQFRAVLPGLKALGSPAVDRLRRDLNESPTPQWPDPTPRPPWPAPEAPWPETIARAEGVLTEHFALVQTLPLEEFPHLAEGLRRAGYRPVRLRPYQRGSAVQVAAVWQRDGRDWRLVLDVAPDPVRPADGDWPANWLGLKESVPRVSALERQDESWRKQGFVPVDVAAYLTADRKPGVRYAALWARQRPGEREYRLLAAVPTTQYKAAIQDLIRSGFIPWTLQELRADGSYQTCAIWARPGSTHRKDTWATSELAYERLLTPSDLQVDLSLTPAPPLPAYQDPYEDWQAEFVSLAQQGERIKLTGLRDAVQGVKFLGAGKNREAVGAFSTSMSNPLTATLLPCYSLRAIAHARLGESEAALKDLALNKGPLDVLLRLAASIPVQRGIDAYGRMVTLAHLDRDPEAVPDLEAFIRAYAHNGNALFEAALAYAEAATVLADDRPTPAASPATPGAGRKPRDPAQAAAARGRARRYADRALELLQQACLLEHECKHALETHPYLQMLRDRPEFRALLRRIHPRRRYAAVWRPDSTDFIGRELHGLTPEAHRQRGHELAAAGYRPVAISVAAVNPDGPPVAASVWHRPILSEEARDARARRQANAAVALLRLGHPETVWPLLVSSPDPRRRTYLIHAFAALDTEPGLLLDRFAREPDVSVRRALLRSLGLYRRERLVVSQREAFTRTLLRVYREDPDPGLHAAAGWLLRRWGHDAETQQLDRERAQRVPPGDRRWYVNRQGQTFAVIPGPIDCWLGSPGAEPNRGEEPLRRRRIGRTYAIGTQLVTVEQFLRFRPRHAYEHAKSPDRAGPIIQVDWFEAARYCRWLSEQEGIPESQMCFPPISRIGPDMQLPPDYLRRTGYRLPTEAEWECACRAGAVTSRFYGNDPRLLPSYAWFTDDAHGRAWKVGLLAPNDWGLFDVHGNVEEWCLDASDGSLVYRSEGLPDEAPLGNLASDRVFRGGCYLKVAARARCAARGSEPAEKVFTDLGFRIARTLVPAEQIRPPH